MVPRAATAALLALLQHPHGRSGCVASLLGLERTRR